VSQVGLKPVQQVQGSAVRWRLPALGLVLGGGIAVLLGAASRAFTPHYRNLPGFGFSNNLTFKSWLASGVLLLAFLQLVTALWMFGRLPFVRRRPPWLQRSHRAVGASAFVLSLPVAFCCLYSYGFAPSPWTARTLAHSVLGCAFYGAFGAKVLFVRRGDDRPWLLPLAGAALVVLVVVLWMSSALWFFHATGLHS
jgi:hypothetical protein